jgi:general secretion pathway protein A
MLTDATPYAPDSYDGYEQYYNLKERPFTLSPDPRFLFESRSYAAALNEVTQALRRRETVMVVTGEIGTGKTLLCRTVLERLEARTFLCVVKDPQLSADELLRQVLTEFGVLSPGRALDSATRHDLVTTLQQFLATLVPLGAHAVITIDEAQHLNPDVLEQIRLLSNAESDQGKLLQIMLVGQPELEATLSRPELRAFTQRITRRSELRPLEPDEIEPYVDHRLTVAYGGREGSTNGVRLTPEAFDLIGRISGGSPRVINILCDRALEVGYQRHAAVIGEEEIGEAARRLKLAVPRTRPAMPKAWMGGAAAAAVVVAGIAWAVLNGPASPDDRTAGLSGTAEQTASAAPSPTSAQTSMPSATPTAGSMPSPSVATSGQAAPAGPEPPSLGPESFSVVVASFRTATRAASVAAEVAQLQLPVSTRRIPGPWEQVIVGPYRSREEADEARQRLEQAHFTNAQIVKTNG